MHGKITNYDSETEIGTIRADNGKDYTLSVLDIRSNIVPKIGLYVNFEPHDDKATEVYVISEEVHHATPPEFIHHVPKKSSSIVPSIVGIVSLLLFIGLVIYAELHRKETREGHEFYASQIKKIETLLLHKNCSGAKDEYYHAKDTREKIEKRGFYFSMDTHAQQAHALEIAECYARINEYDEAVSMLDINGRHTPDYLLRASVIYENSGDTEMAEKAKSLADEFDISR